MQSTRKETMKQAREFIRNMEKINGIDSFEKKLEDSVQDKRVSFITDYTKKIKCYIDENKTFLPSVMSNPLYSLIFAYDDNVNEFGSYTFVNMEVSEDKWYIEEYGYPLRKEGGEYFDFRCRISNYSYQVQKCYKQPYIDEDGEPYIDEDGNELINHSIDFGEDIPYDFSGTIGKLYTIAWKAVYEYKDIYPNLSYDNDRAFSKHIIPCYHTCLKSLSKNMSSLLGYDNVKQQQYKLYVCVIELMLSRVKDEVDTLIEMNGFDDEETNVTLDYYNNVETDMNKILENLKMWPIETELMIRAMTNRTNVASNEVCNMIKGFI